MPERPAPVVFRVAVPGGRQLLMTPRRGLVRGGRPLVGRGGPALRHAGPGQRLLGAIRGAPRVLRRGVVRRFVPGQLPVAFPQLG